MNSPWTIALAIYVASTLALCLLVAKAPQHCMGAWRSLRWPLALVWLVCLGFTLTTGWPVQWTPDANLASFPDAWPWPFAAMAATMAIAGNTWLFAHVGYALTSAGGLAPDDRH